MIDFAGHSYKNTWFRHPAIGDPSFDTFQRYPHNPVYKGEYPFEWPVNGTLFQDPVSKRLYMYITLYYKGYWSVTDAEKSLHCMAYRSDDDGATWREIGIVLEGTKHSYDGENGMRGGAADMCVVYDQGVYHAIFGWATSANTDGGIGYARASSPEGPFVLSETPIHQESTQQLLMNKYKRVYASSLIKRERDWLIIAMMSTPKNWGGTWALVRMTSERPEGPYSAPELLLYPQSKVYHPPIVEFFPAFQDDRFVYCPFTSLALNRTFQIIYKAEKEKAHLAGAWQIEKYGSIWHAEDLEHESQGIWGQTFAGLLDEVGRFRVMYPAKTAPEEDRGTINYAECEWADIDRADAFYLSAPNGPSLSFIQREFGEFSMRAEISSRGEKAIFWAYNSPIGPDLTTAGASLHPIMLRDMEKLAWEGGRWSLVKLDGHGQSFTVASGTYRPSGDVFDSIRIVHALSASSVSINGDTVWRGQLEIRTGKIGLLAGNGSNMRVAKMELDRPGTPCRVTYLSTEGLIGAGEAQMKPAAVQEPDHWEKIEGGLLRFGFGYKTDVPGNMVKWNYVGSRCQVWSPKGSSYGKFRLYLDGELSATIDLHDPEERESGVVFKSGEIPFGYHAVTLELLEGVLVCDSFDFCV